MGIISKIRNLFNIPFKTRIIRDHSSFFSFFNRNLATNETIFSAVNMISNAIASAPPGVFKDGKKLKPKEHNLAMLFKFGPNPRMTMFNFIKTLEVNRCTVEEGEQLAQRIVELGVTAVFATADILAIGIMKGLEALGKCVPDDVSVIGFDNLDVSNLVTPSLTSINQQVPQKVDVAIETLLEMLNGQTLAGKTVKIKPDIVYRESVKKLNK